MVVQVLLEGEEEIGSASLPGLLKKKKALLRAELAVSCDGGQISEDQGGIPISMRGRVSLDLEAQTLAHDVHSGMSHPQLRGHIADIPCTIDVLGVLEEVVLVLWAGILSCRACIVREEFLMPRMFEQEWSLQEDTQVCGI